MSAVATVYTEMDHALLVDEALRLRETNASLLAALSDLYDRRTPESMAHAREAMAKARGQS